MDFFCLFGARLEDSGQQHNLVFVSETQSRKEEVVVVDVDLL